MQKSIESESYHERTSKSNDRNRGPGFVAGNIPEREVSSGFMTGTRKNTLIKLAVLVVVAFLILDLLEFREWSFDRYQSFKVLKLKISNITQFSKKNPDSVNLNEVVLDSTTPSPSASLKPMHMISKPSTAPVNPVIHQPSTAPVKPVISKPSTAPVKPVIHKPSTAPAKPVILSPSISKLTISHSCDQDKRVKEISGIIERSKKLPSKWLDTYRKNHGSWGFPNETFPELQWISPSNTSPARMSVIVATRNDGYGGDPLERLRNSLQQFVEFDWSVHVEYILVEFNVNDKMTPTHEVPRIHDQVLKIKDKNNFSLRVIRVDEKYSKNINMPGFSCGLFEYWGKNVGMRRATSDWLLTTNIDDTFSIPLIKFLDSSLAQNSLDKKGFYTALRGGVHPSVFAGRSTSGLISLDKNCNLQGPHGSELTKSCGVVKSKRDPIFVGDFQLLHVDQLYSNFGGGFLEVPFSFSLDSEWLMRNVHANRLNGNIVDCKYCHYNHNKERK